ncbi:putative polysaccharide pyruvyl transferase [Gordonia polyisoprenivorans VH2]|uniref:Putative polysaccharide pyruvyl transferase n=3 Tax=Gordonia TaxID=2053 RepID=H6N1U1_GORPV|nr:putative polysaccharide pyruvyl transferase [Gordonia polyisoprenivorans VH2]OPX13939.1 polysaccharide pyruvyl transferase [Gordonia sp. i37]
MISDMSAISSIQAETLDILRTVIPAGSTVALLDFPNHANAGDVLIYRGELAYLQRLGCEIAYTATFNTYDKGALASAVSTGPILLHGGGNFGDRYPIYQPFRERVIGENRDRPIICLPQTFEYTDQSALTHTQQVYGEHPDLTLLIRDRSALQRVTELFPANQVRYCPDTALGTGRIDPAREPDHDVVFLKRTDDESAFSVDDIPQSLIDEAFTHDWRMEWFGYDLKWWPQSLAIVSLSMVPVFRRRIHRWAKRAFDRQSELIVHSAVDALSRGRVVLTDRLHGAVLGVLLEKPVVMVDNANSKLSAAFRDYLATFAHVALARDFHEGYDVAKSMASTL